MQKTHTFFGENRFCFYENMRNQPDETPQSESDEQPKKEYPISEYRSKLYAYSDPERVDEDTAHEMRAAVLKSVGIRSGYADNIKMKISPTGYDHDCRIQIFSRKTNVELFSVTYNPEKNTLSSTLTPDKKARLLKEWLQSEEDPSSKNEKSNADKIIEKAESHEFNISPDENFTSLESGEQAFVLQEARKILGDSWTRSLRLVTTQTQDRKNVKKVYIFDAKVINRPMLGTVEFNIKTNKVLSTRTMKQNIDRILKQE